MSSPVWVVLLALLLFPDHDCHALQPSQTTALKRTMTREREISADGGVWASAKKSRAPTVAFLVRTYAPTDETTKRIAQWVSSLQASSDVDAFISIDQTHKHNVSSLLNKLSSTGFDLGRIHRYTTDDMLQAYPALKGLVFYQQYPPYHEGNLTLGYHTPAIDLFLQTLPQKHSTYDYLWVIEDDVGYTGDISKLFEAYSGSADDLIGGTLRGTLRGYYQDDDQYAEDDDQMTAKYMDWVPSAQRICGAEHTTRMSARLLGKLHDWMVAGALDFSECMPASVCQVEHMQYSVLKAKDLGRPYTWDPLKAIESKASWEEIQSKDAAEARTRLYHPVKL